MNILHVENSSGQGGSVRSLMELMPAPNGWQSLFLALERQGSKNHLPEGCMSLATQNPFKVWKMLKDKSIDLVHVNNAPIEAWSVILAAAWEGLPIISHMRTVRPLRLIEKLLCRCLDKILVLSQTHKQRAGGGDFFEVVPNGIKDQGRGPQTTEPTLGIFSALKPDKGHRELLLALSKISSPFKLLVVGGPVDDQPDLTEELKNLCHELSLENQVEFTGHVDNPLTHMDRCRLVVDTSLKAEGFRRVLGEAALRGRQCLATDVGGCADLLDRDARLDSNNVDSWARIFDETLRKDDPEAGSRLREKALQLFNPQISRDAFWNVCLSAVTHRRTLS